ncbi:MAG: phage tail protein, partial [Loktanella sp.]|nr:phage tail protein [Loktanella sp.]
GAALPVTSAWDGYQPGTYIQTMNGGGVYWTKNRLLTFILPNGVEVPTTTYPSGYRKGVIGWAWYYEGVSLGDPTNGEIFYSYGGALYRTTVNSFTPLAELEFWFASPFSVRNSQIGSSLHNPPIYSVGLDMYLVIVDGRGDYYRRSFAYGLKRDGSVVWSKELIASPTNLQMPGFNRSRPVPFVVGNRFQYFGNGRLATIDIGTGDVTIDPIPGNTPSLSGPQFYLDQMGAILYWGRSPEDGRNYWFIAYMDHVKQSEIMLSGIIMDQAGKTGIEPWRFDFSQLDDKPVAGYLIESPQSARKTIEDLAQVFMFDITESDDILKVVSRGQASSTFIRERDLAVIGEADVYSEQRIQEIELPRTTNFTFVDPKNDYQNGTAHFRRPTSPFSGMQSRETLDVNIPIALSPDEASQTAERITYAAWQERVSTRIKLPFKHVRLDPTDVITVQMDDGLTFEGRIVQTDLGADYSTEIEMIAQGPALYTRVEDPDDFISGVPAFDPDSGWLIDPFTRALVDPGDGSLVHPYTGAPVETPFDPTVDYPPYDPSGLHNPYDTTSTGTRPRGPVKLQKPVFPAVLPWAGDLPFTDDDDRDDAPGPYPLYWGAKAEDPNLLAGSIQFKRPGADWRTAKSTESPLIHGTVINDVAAPPRGTFATDDKSVLTVIPQYDFEGAFEYEWESVDDSEWPSERNMILIDREIILFKEVEDNGDGTLSLSTLIRGYRGTDVWAGAHDQGAEFVLMNTPGVKLATLGSNDLRNTVTYRVLGGAFRITPPVEGSLDYRANAFRPYAVNHIRRADAGGDSTVSWERRTRFNGEWRDGTDAVPLNEEQEQYRVFIFDAAQDPEGFDPYNGTALRMVETTAPAFTYTGAMKSADGLAADDPFHIVIYQMSADVDFGLPAGAHLRKIEQNYWVS